MAKILKTLSRLLIDKNFDKKSGFNKNDFIFGFIGRFTSQKNCLFVIDIINKQIKFYQRNSIELVMVSDGELKENSLNPKSFHCTH